MRSRWTDTRGVEPASRSRHRRRVRIAASAFRSQSPRPAFVAERGRRRVRGREGSSRPAWGGRRRVTPTTAPARLPRARPDHRRRRRSDANRDRIGTPAGIAARLDHLVKTATGRPSPSASTVDHQCRPTPASMHEPGPTTKQRRSRGRPSRSIEDVHCRSIDVLRCSSRRLPMPAHAADFFADASSMARTFLSDRSTRLNDVCNDVPRGLKSGATRRSS